MSLDVVVYRNREHLELGQDEKHAKVVPETGEIYFENSQLSRRYNQRVEAVGHRLGNVALISVLRAEASQLVGSESLLVRKILYSGAHSGDSIPLGDLQELSSELDRIRKTRRESHQMQSLVGALEDLIQAAKDEGNPIVFV